MSFHQQIKNFRKENDLSQEEFAQFLSKKIEGRQFIDTGTVSRWERQTNTPSIHNQIYILRKLGIKISLTSVLAGAEAEEVHEQAISLLQNRFNRFSGLADKPYRASLPSFTYTESKDIDSFLNDKVLRSFNHNVIGVDFFNPKLLSVLLADIEVDDIKVIKFYRDTQIVGHVAYAKLQTAKLVKFLKYHCKASVVTHFETDANAKTLLNFSAYASDFSLYLFYAHHLTEVIEQDPAIDWYVGHSFINDDWQVQKKLGAKVMACGNTAEHGGVKIGKVYTDSVMFSTSAATLLSSPLSGLRKDDVHQYANLTKIG